MLRFQHEMFCHAQPAVNLSISSIFVYNHSIRLLQLKSMVTFVVSFG